MSENKKQLLQETSEDKSINTLSKLEQEHIDLLKQINVMCRSNKKSFTDRTRLEVIESLVENHSPFHKIYSGDHCDIYGQSDIEKLPENIILISSHADTVPSITKCYSEYDENTGFLKGTYDNTITNTAEVILMREEHIPENVVFAFTGEEETGACKGAKEAAKFLHGLGKKLFCMALDVTYEGFHQNRLFTMENCVTSGYLQLNQLAAIAANMEPDQNQSFEFVPANKTCIPKCIEQTEFLSKSMGMYDEAMAYRDIGYPTMSICIPCSGNMHGDSGLSVKQPVFEGYLMSLASLIYKMTKTHDYLIESYKIARDNCIDKAKEIHLPRPKYSNNYYSDYSSFLHTRKEQQEIDDYNAGFGVSYSGDYMSDLDEYMCNLGPEDLYPIEAYIMGELHHMPHLEEAYEETYGLMIEELKEQAVHAKSKKKFINHTEIPYDLFAELCQEPEEEPTEEDIEHISNFLSIIYDIAHEYQKEETNFLDDFEAEYYNADEIEYDAGL